MLVFLISSIYLIGHFGIYYVSSKLRLGDGPNTLTYMTSYYFTLFLSPIFILVVSLIVTNIASQNGFLIHAEYCAVILALLLIATISIMAISKNSQKKSRELAFKNSG